MRRCNRRRDPDPMTQPDDDILRELNRLADEEHELDRTSATPSPGWAERRREIDISLARCWDLLRQRRARRRAGLDPADAALRPAGVVERYRQ